MAGLEELMPADRLAAEALRAKGALVDAVVWTNSSVVWSDYDAVVIRSPWDYHLQPRQFLVWLETLERSGTRVFNPLSILRWNLDKHYLLDLKARNIQIPRTMFIEPGDSLDVERVREIFSDEEIVVKPAISASAWETRRIRLSDLSSEDLDWMSGLRPQNCLILQEYMPEVRTEGEWSFIFFGTAFSHAVVKQPAGEDFRVQEEWGGTSMLERPSLRHIESAREIIRTIHEPLLYARVDAVVRNGELYLMELELVEPALYFDAMPPSADAFCERFDAIFQ